MHYNSITTRHNDVPILYHKQVQEKKKKKPNREKKERRVPFLRRSPILLREVTIFTKGSGMVPPPWPFPEKCSFGNTEVESPSAR